MDFTDQVKEFIRVDNQIKSSRESLKPIRERRKALVENILERMADSKLKVVKLPTDKCELLYRERPKRPHPLKTKLEDVLGELEGRTLTAEMSRNVIRRLVPNAEATEEEGDDVKVISLQRRRLA
jgi:hypothetical protein